MIVWINNRNRLTTTKAMVAYLRMVHGAEPIIVDNASTYPPLLEWYATGPCKIVRLPDNRGPRAPWTLPFDLAMGGKHYAVTDSDLDLEGVPSDLLLQLRDGLLRYPAAIKAGMSLEIDDLPNDKPLTPTIRAWESQFWQKQLSDQWWSADVDTTFALYRAGTGWGRYGPAIRANRPYTARHVPWYCEDSNEERYYTEHCDPQWPTWATRRRGAE